MSNTKGIIEINPQINVNKITKEDIKNHLCSKATDTDIKLALAKCASTGVNPFVGDVDFIKYDSTKPMQIVFRKDWFFKIANRQEDYLGIKHGVIVMRKNEIVYQEGAFLLSDDTLLGGWAEVHRKEKLPHRAEVSMAEYNKGKSQWGVMPATMINKVAKVQALRECYAEIFGGVSDESELGIIEYVQNEEANEQKNKSIEIDSKPHDCTECGSSCTEKEKEYSLRAFNRIVCFSCQKKVKNQNNDADNKVINNAI
jgi:phage recombination protein Bet